MNSPVRFEITLPAEKRRALHNLAKEVGVSASDLARLAIARLLASPDEFQRHHKTTADPRASSGPSGGRDVERAGLNAGAEE